MPKGDREAGGLLSMTGYARQTGGLGDLSWTWEIKSVNGKGLDVRSRLPYGWEALEPPLRQRVAAKIARGNLQINFQPSGAAGALSVSVNEDLLERLLTIAETVQDRHKAIAPARLDGLLGLRGVLEITEAGEDSELREARAEQALADLDAALDQLVAARAEEGERLGRNLSAILDRIEALREEASARAEAQPDAIRDRLTRQISELLQADTPVPEERLAQEIAVMAGKADVREELDRLAGHLSAVRQLLGQGGPVGRKLDFLCQELGREANTLSAKAADQELSRVALEIKAAVDQLREQVQNIE